MGPTILFDKSLLQSLNSNESVFLQQFFLTNITPLFYVETLGDLDLGTHKGGRPITEIIGALASKVPSLGIFPNIDYSRLVLGNLLGIPVEMKGRTIRDPGVTKIDPDGNVGVHYDKSPEEEALSRWQSGKYTDIERLFSVTWRSALSGISYDRVLGIIKNVVPANVVLSNPGNVYEFVNSFVEASQKELLYLTFELFGLPESYFPKILERWSKGGLIPYVEFAPYAAYVLKVDLFFYINMLKGFESKNRPSHKVDLAYLYYLPFCNVFTSSDKLHQRIVRFFLRDDQLYISGEEFKAGLQELHEYYIQFKDKIDEVGLIGFAYQPPKELDNEITRAWDKIFPNWRKSNPTSHTNADSNATENKDMVGHINRVQKESREIKTAVESDDVHHVISTHSVPIQKGVWRLVPKGLENKKSSEH